MSAQKKLEPMPEPVKKMNSSNSSDNVMLKAEIDRMKKLISEKIKDPNVAKKAALIISDMINKMGVK